MKIWNKNFPECQIIAFLIINNNLNRLKIDFKIKKIRNKSKEINQILLKQLEEGKKCK